MRHHLLCLVSYLPLCLLTAADAMAESPEVGSPSELAPLELVEVVASRRADAAEKLDAHVNLHVLLQWHGQRQEGVRVETDRSRVCADRVLATARTLVDNGVHAAVVEGLNLVGTYADPKPVDRRKGESAAERLTRLTGLTVYGFESEAIQPRTIERMGVMRKAAEDLTYLKEHKEEIGGEEQQLARLYEIQTELFPANTEFVVAGTPIRSFQALQAAFSVADERDENDVIVLIGTRHWTDFAHAVEQADRLGNDLHVGVRLYRYECE